MSQKCTRVIFDGEVIVSPHFSGVGHYTLELLRAIDRQLNNSGSICFSLLINFRHIKKARSFGFKNIALVRSPFPLEISNGLKTHGIQPPLDAFFGQGIYIFPNFSSWPLLHSKSVSFIYDITYHKHPQLTEPRNQTFLSKQVQKSAKRADLIATISKSSKDDISKLYHIDKEQINIYYPAVSTADYRPRQLKEIEDIKKKYAINGDYLLFVGNIEPRKNLKNLLLAYEKLPHDLQEKYALLIIGAKGWQDGEIFKTINRLKSKRLSILIPSQYVTDKDLPALYSGATIFIFPSVYEGFGIPPIEAMACGTPVVCADNSSLPEAVGDAALMIDALSVRDMVSKISLLLNDNKLQKSLVEKGFKQVQKFSWDKSAQQFISDLKKLA